MIAADYTRKPVKPCLDAEPGYEDHPVELRSENGYFDEHDVRKSAYWALFAGALRPHLRLPRHLAVPATPIARRSRSPGPPGGRP